MTIARRVAHALVLGLVFSSPALSACTSAPSPALPTTGNSPAFENTTSSPLASDNFGYGIQVDLLGADPGLILNGVHGMRFNWVSQSVSWREVEAQPGVFDWVALDRAVEAASASGVRVLLSVDGTPDWARSIGADLTLDGPPADLASFGRFVGVLATRYSGRVAAYEIWPRPNLAQAWNDPFGVSPAAYTHLLRSAYLGIKSADPLAIVVSGGLAMIAPDESVAGMGQSDLEFLRGMYESNADQWHDALGIELDRKQGHPAPTSSGFRQYEAIREVMLANSDNHGRIWITSAGWSTAADVSEEQQAEYLVAAFQLARTVPYIDLMMVNNFNYSVTQAHPDMTGYSLIRPDWSARPAFLSLARMRQDEVLFLPETGSPVSTAHSNPVTFGKTLTSFLV